MAVKPSQGKKTLSKNGKIVGRPRKEFSLTEQVRSYLIQHPEYAGKLVNAWLNMIISGRNVMALQEFLNRFEGKVIEKHEIETKLPITLVFAPAIGELSPPSQPLLEAGNVVDSEATVLSDCAQV